MLNFVSPASFATVVIPTHPFQPGQFNDHMRTGEGLSGSWWPLYLGLRFIGTSIEVLTASCHHWK